MRLPKRILKADYWINEAHVAEEDIRYTVTHNFEVVGVRLEADDGKYRSKLDSQYGIVRSNKRVPEGWAFVERVAMAQEEQDIITEFYETKFHNR